MVLPPPTRSSPACAAGSQRLSIAAACRLAASLLVLLIGVPGSPALAVQPAPPRILELQPAPKMPLAVRPVQPEVELRLVPSVLGMSESQARSVLERAGFATGGVSRVASAAAAGTVVSQSVAAGTRHDPRRPIALQLSLGTKPEIKVFKPPVITPDVFKGLITPPPGPVTPQPPPQPVPPRDDVQPGFIVVPELRGANETQARARLQLRRLKLGRIDRRPDDARAGIVIDQSPAAGTQLERPVTVNVVVSSGPEPLTVPNVVGLRLEPALERLAPLRPGQVDEQWIASNQPRGIVLRQSPAAGSRIKPTPPPRLRLFVSAGPRRIVPNVVERLLPEAERLISAVDLRVGVIREVESDVPAGRVIEQKPRAGTDIAANRVEAVDLLVSRGRPAPVMIEVPNVVGRDEPAAREQITAAGLAVGSVAREHTPERAGIVVEQKPRAGARFPRGEPVSVDLLVSLGPPPPPVARAMPDLIGAPLEAVPERLAPLELSLAGVRSRASTESKGTVVAQQPAAGTAIKPGSRVDVTVSDGSRVRVPALVGRSRAQAAQLLRGADLSARESTRESPPPEGIVLEQRPQAGTEVARGSLVQMVVAAVQPETSAEVPDVLGVPITPARQRIEQAGLAVATGEADSLTYEAGTVAAQSPAGGAQVARDSTVQLTISLGLPPLPDLVGMPVTQARVRLAQFGLSAILSEQRADDQPRDVVLAQTPGAGVRLARGAEVALVVSIGRTDGGMVAPTSATGPLIPPAVLVAGAAGGVLVLAGGGALLARRWRATRKADRPAAKQGAIDARVRLEPMGRATEITSAPELAGPDVRIRVRLEHGEPRTQQHDDGGRA